jgi:hypothetical protein
VRRLALTALLLVVPVVSGCGGEGRAASEEGTTPRAGGYLTASDLERQLGNAFRKGLYRLAVMTQRSDEAPDLGQPLPTGLLRGVRCGSKVPRPTGGRAWAWSCSVAWRTVERRAEQTRYLVRLRPGKCFAAGATPERQSRYDATIRSYSVDPLNALGSVRGGC